MRPDKARGRPPKREPLDAVVGLIAGVLWGATTSLAAGLWIIPGSFVITGVVMALASLVFRVLGYYKGDDFFRWLRDHWFD